MIIQEAVALQGSAPGDLLPTSHGSPAFHFCHSLDAHSGTPSVLIFFQFCSLSSRSPSPLQLTDNRSHPQSPSAGSGRAVWAPANPLPVLTHLLRNRSGRVNAAGRGMVPRVTTAPFLGLRGRQRNWPGGRVHTRDPQRWTGRGAQRPLRTQALRVEGAPAKSCPGHCCEHGTAGVVLQKQGSHPGHCSVERAAHQPSW